MPKDRFRREKASGRLRSKRDFPRLRTRKKLWRCPACGQSSAIMKFYSSSVLITCSCGLEYVFDRKPALEAIDYYNEMVDEYYNKMGRRGY